MTKKTSEKIMGKVKEFLSLNDSQRDTQLDQKGIKRWFQLKQELEQILFSTPPSSVPFKEKRKSIRIRNLKIPVQFEHAMEKMDAQISEISEGGLFLKTTDLIPVGTTLLLKVHLPGDFREKRNVENHELEISAQVVFNHGGSSFGDKAFSGMGMRFAKELQDPLRKEWFSLVDYLLQESMD